VHWGTLDRVTGCGGVLPAGGRCWWRWRSRSRSWSAGSAGWRPDGAGRGDRAPAGTADL